MPLNHRTPSPFTALLLAAAVGASGCLTITPPIRNAGYGAPGHAAPDEFEIGVGHDLNVWFTGDEDAVIPGLFKLNLVAPVWHDSPTPGRVNTVRLEFAGDFFMGGWGYAIAGFRFDSAPEGQGKGRRGLAWDIEAGVAGGGLSSIPIGGGYVGGGIAHWSGIFAPFGRLRYQVAGSGVEGVLTTMYIDTMVGLSIAPKVLTFTLAAGPTTMFVADTFEGESVSSAVTPILSVEMDFTFRIPVGGKR